MSPACQGSCIGVLCPAAGWHPCMCLPVGKALLVCIPAHGQRSLQVDVGQWISSQVVCGLTGFKATAGNELASVL